MNRALLMFLATALVGCRQPRYARYPSPAGDFRCEAPWGWSAVQERQGDAYSSLTFLGPFDPDFYLGRPSLQVRWHAYGKPRTLPGGGTEAYASAEDFARRLVAEVYGPGAWLVEERRAVEIGGREGFHFVVLSPAPVAASAKFGVSMDEEGRRVNLRQHAWAVLPMRSGLYALCYPATRQGYPKHLDRFHRLVNTFQALRDGPP